MAPAHDELPLTGPPAETRVPGRRTKSAEALRTISEVSAEVGVPQHTLRFWETRFSQIKPLKRGGGRRYYRPEDRELLGRIRAWLYDDSYTIKGVQKLLRDGGTVLPAGSGRAAAAPDTEGAGRAERASAPAPAREAATAPVLRRAAAAPAGTADREGGATPPTGAPSAGGPSAGGPSAAVPSTAAPSAAAPSTAARSTGARGRGRHPAAAGGSRPSGAPADLVSLQRAGLLRLIEGLEEIRDRLRGPPPEP